MQGRTDLPLDACGRAQAFRLAEEATAVGFAALWTSHLLRARETADAVAAHLGLAPHADERLAEADMGRWEGCLKSEIERDHPEGWRAYHERPESFYFPGGESLAGFAGRVVEALDEVASGPLPALVVCHGGTVRCAVATRRREGLAAYHERAVPNAELIWLDSSPASDAAGHPSVGRLGG